MAFKTYSITKKYIDPYKVPFYVEDVSGSDNILKIEDLTNNPVRNTIEYSFDNRTWVILGTTSNTAISMTIPSNTRVYLRSIATTWSNGDGLGCPITCTNNYNVGGNIMSMLFGSNFTGNETEFPSNTSRNFRSFLKCNKLVNANELLLPAITLTPQCYNYMFIGCTSLTTAPELPATTLANYCYQGMFNGCTSLNSIKCLATDISATECTTKWLNGVAASGTFTTPSSTAWSTGVNGIPEGWTRVDV